MGSTLISTSSGRFFCRLTYVVPPDGLTAKVQRRARDQIERLGKTKRWGSESRAGPRGRQPVRWSWLLADSAPGATHRPTHPAPEATTWLSPVGHHDAFILAPAGRVCKPASAFAALRPANAGMSSVFAGASKLPRPPNNVATGKQP